MPMNTGNEPPKGKGILVTIIVVAGNQEFKIPLDKGKLATVEAVCFMAEELTGFNATFKQERLVSR